MPDHRPTRDIFSVSRLNAEMRAVIEGSFPMLWVEGEVSNLSTPRSGHLYFSLKDAHAQVRCALFRNKRQWLRQLPADGDQILVRARVSLYEPRGDFQLIVEHLEPAGAGSAQRAFEALKRQLQAEGLFDAARKRELPRFPRRLGVITSPSGAAIRDVLQVLKRRAPQLPVTIFPAAVQGAGAAEELVTALDVAVRRGDCDVLLITRGGGSIEDLAAFNDERLARAIAAAEVPIVSAVGHEIDFSISDFVADRRAPTPSAAAELVSPDRDTLLDGLAASQRRLEGALRRRLSQAQRQLAGLEGRLRRAAPAVRLRQQQQRLDGLDIRLNRSVRQRLSASQTHLRTLGRRLRNQGPAQRLKLVTQRFLAQSGRIEHAWQAQQHRRHERLTSATRQLQALSPLATMHRGYAILRQAEDGAVVGSVSQVKSGSRLKGVIADGVLDLKVQGISAPVDLPDS